MMGGDPLLSGFEDPDEYDSKPAPSERDNPMTSELGE